MSGFTLSAHEFSSPLRVKFGHASAVRQQAQTLLVLAKPKGAEAEADGVGIGECCPREYVTGESLESVLEFFTAHKADLEVKIRSLADLRSWMADHEAEIDQNPAAFSALEIALIDLLAKQARVTLEAFLGLPDLQDGFRYSAVLGDSSPFKFWLQAALYWGAGFRDFKFKLSGNLDRDRSKLAIFRLFKKHPAFRLRADANNLWSDAPSCIGFLRELDTPIWAIEEPVGRNDHAAQEKIARALSVKIILDESLLRASQIGDLTALEDLVIANIRVSKCGGLLRSLALANEATKHAIPMIFGAHVGETSVLTRAAMTVANAFPDAALAQEGGFGRLLLKVDAVYPSLRFGWAGLLKPRKTLPKGHYGSGLQPEARAFADKAPSPDEDPPGSRSGAGL